MAKEQKPPGQQDNQNKSIFKSNVENAQGQNHNFLKKSKMDEFFIKENYFMGEGTDSNLKYIVMQDQSGAEKKEGFEPTLIQPGKDLLSIVPFCSAVFVHKAK